VTSISVLKMCCISWSLFAQTKLPGFCCATLYSVAVSWSEMMLHCVMTVVADYDSPVAENGDLTEKYFIIQKVLGEMLPASDGLLLFLVCLFICLSVCLMSALFLSADAMYCFRAENYVGFTAPRR